jgi:hypothetical protein
MAAKRWSDLSKSQRLLVTVAAVLEGAFKIVALRDLKQRPAEEVRGPKWGWATGITLVNGFGVAPLTYFLLGRKKPSS